MVYNSNNSFGFPPNLHSPYKFQIFLHTLHGNTQNNHPRIRRFLAYSLDRW